MLATPHYSPCVFFVSHEAINTYWLSLRAPCHQNRTDWFLEYHAIKTSPCLQQLHWLPTSEKQNCLHDTCVAVQSLVVPSLIFLSCLQAFHCLCCPSDKQAPAPTLKFSHKTNGFYTFLGFSPHVWNSLPQDFRHSAAVSSFKNKLKDTLFSKYFD